MSISQAAVSISSAFPVLAADEPPRRPGNGPAFAAALAENRAAATKPPRAAEPTSSDEAAAPDDAEAADEPGPATPATAADAGQAPDAGQQLDDEADADTDGDAGTHTSEELVGSPFPQAALRPPIAEASLNLVEGTDGSAFVPPLPAAVTSAPAPESDPVLADLPEMLADSAGDAPVGVRAAQLPFLPVGTDAGTAPKITEAVTAPALVQVSASLSPAAQTSLAIAGFGQGLSVLWTAGRSASGEGQETVTETLPDMRNLPRLGPQVNQPVAATGDEAAANLLDPGLAAIGELPLDGVAEVVPLSGGSSSQATAAAPAPAAQTAMATPAQLAPLVVTVARQNGPSDITVTLSPVELGTLHMRVSMEGDSLRITLLADRPETLDLLRRNGDQLLADLRDLGFGGASLGFGTSGGTGTPAPHDGKDDAADVLPAAAAPQQIPPAPSRVQRAGGLDLRL